MRTNNMISNIKRITKSTIETNIPLSNTEYFEVSITFNTLNGQPSPNTCL